jgi:hypothetical protein
MQVYQTNDAGYFVGVTYADQSPLEPDVWLIPGGCVTIEPPNIEDKVAKWVNGVWVLEDIPVTEEVEN